MSSIASLASGLLHAVLPPSLLPNNAAADNGSLATSQVARRPDVVQISSPGQLAATLQQLQQSNPTQYTQVTEQIATNLQTAAQTAQSNGNTAAAAQLNRLSTDFRSASASGQVPNLAGAGGGHFHPLHGIVELSSPGNDATAIIQNTLTNAGIS